MLHIPRRCPWGRCRWCTAGLWISWALNTWCPQWRSAERWAWWRAKTSPQWYQTPFPCAAGIHASLTQRMAWWDLRRDRKTEKVVTWQRVLATDVWYCCPCAEPPGPPWLSGRRAWSSWTLYRPHLLHHVERILKNKVLKSVMWLRNRHRVKELTILVGGRDSEYRSVLNFKSAPNKQISTIKREEECDKEHAAENWVVLMTQLQQRPRVVGIWDEHQDHGDDKHLYSSTRGETKSKKLDFHQIHVNWSHICYTI